jgi:DNA-binding FadR family transcriptional regulator
MHSDDREEAIGFHEAIQDAIEKRDIEHLSAALASLKELLFFVEGH